MPKVRINGIEIEVPQGSSLLQAAQSLGIAIPALCHQDGLKPHTSCMVCVVENKETGILLPACSAAAEEGLAVTLLPLPGPGADPMAVVMDGTADFGVNFGAGVVTARSQGLPITAIATSTRQRNFRGTWFIDYTFRFEQEGELVYESMQTAAWTRSEHRGLCPDGWE